MSGLFDAAQLPLALMVSADQVPFCFADIQRPRHKAGLLDPRSEYVLYHAGLRLFPAIVDPLRTQIQVRQLRPVSRQNRHGQT